MPHRNSHLVELLQEFEEVMRATRCPYFDYVAPVTDLDRIETVLKSVDLPLVPDAAAIYQWHGGTLPVKLSPKIRLTPTGLLLLSPESSLTRYEIMDVDDRAAWLPVMQIDGGVICIDVSRVDSGGSSPAAHLHFQYGWSDEVESLAIPLSWWIEYVKNGTWRWTPNGWEDDLIYDQIPLERRRTGLVL
jgi:hypothetical protein